MQMSQSISKKTFRNHDTCIYDTGKYPQNSTAYYLLCWNGKFLCHESCVRNRKIN